MIQFSDGLGSPQEGSNVLKLLRSHLSNNVNFENLNGFTWQLFHSGPDRVWDEGLENEDGKSFMQNYNMKIFVVAGVRFLLLSKTQKFMLEKVTLI